MHLLLKTILILPLMAVLLGCKVQIEVGTGGHVETKSGAYSCDQNSVCMVDIVDYLFFEEFVAVPDEGYAFRGWKPGLVESTGSYRLCPDEIRRHF